ncbi:hypothetical protein Fmac_032973 [Flemingia macrophylla]|uniref:Uncharacterized protein n=1 Tax=Flemingia macrophylla TaxID=520843 RepID=A0ABD1L6F3_9FABA
MLNEPAFEELILPYTKVVGETNAKDKDEVPSFQLKIYERIPIPDLPVRLDAASILGLLAYFINYKFENVLSSPIRDIWNGLHKLAIKALFIYNPLMAPWYITKKQEHEVDELGIQQNLNLNTDLNLKGHANNQTLTKLSQSLSSQTKINAYKPMHMKERSHNQAMKKHFKSSQRSSSSQVSASVLLDLGNCKGLPRYQLDAERKLEER